MTVPNYATLPTPDTLKFQEWAAVVSEQLGVDEPTDEAGWRDWADSVAEVSGVPETYGFPTWQSWGEALIGTIS